MRDKFNKFMQGRYGVPEISSDDIEVPASFQ